MAVTFRFRRRRTAGFLFRGNFFDRARFRGSRTPHAGGRRFQRRVARGLRGSGALRVAWSTGGFFPRLNAARAIFSRPTFSGRLRLAQPFSPA